MNNARCVITSVGAQCVCQKGTSGVLCERSKFFSINISSKFHSFSFKLINQSMEKSVHSIVKLAVPVFLLVQHRNVTVYKDELVVSVKLVGLKNLFLYLLMHYHFF